MYTLFSSISIWEGSMGSESPFDCNFFYLGYFRVSFSLRTMAFHWQLPLWCIYYADIFQMYTLFSSISIWEGSMGSESPFDCNFFYLGYFRVSFSLRTMAFHWQLPLWCIYYCNFYRWCWSL